MKGPPQCVLATLEFVYRDTVDARRMSNRGLHRIVATLIGLCLMPIVFVGDDDIGCRPQRVNKLVMVCFRESLMAY